MHEYTEVAVGVILRDNAVFLTKRLEHLHQGGKWEFPGGKRELNESIDEALSRELKEEVNIEVLTSAPLMQISHDYGDKRVILDVHIVSEFKGEPTPLESKESAWVKCSDLQDINFPEANKAIVEKLQSLS